MEQQISRTSKVLSILTANWATIAILALLALSGIRLIHSQEKTIDILTNSNEVYAVSYTDMKNRMNELGAQMETNNQQLVLHYTLLNRNVSATEARLSALEKASPKEHIVEAKPGLSTIKAKKAIKENEDKFSCLSGNTEYCSSSLAQ